MRLDMANLLVRAPNQLLAAAAAIAIAGGASSSTAAVPPVPGVPMYCVPGVTATRCRGTFWETGKLYQKGQEGGALSKVEYKSALLRIEELRSVIRGLRAVADEPTEVGRLGEQAAKARAELRQVGERVCNSLAGDERIDSERRLLSVVRTLDDLDIATLQAADEAPNKQQSLPAGFSRVALLLTQASAGFDDFVAQLPPEPDEYVD